MNRIAPSELEYPTLLVTSPHSLLPNTYLKDQPHPFLYPKILRSTGVHF